MAKFKQTLLTEEAYSKLREAKELMEKATGKRVSFTEVINDLVGKQLIMLRLDQDIKNYISAFVDRVSSNRHILGIVLFGSIAKGNFTKFSDIDVAVLTNYNFLECLNYLNKEIAEINDYQDKLIKKGLSLYISPLIITKKDLEKLNPIYFDIADEGVTLFQRENTVSTFFEFLAKIKHKRVNTAAGQILVWE